MHLVNVVGLRMERPADQSIVILREAEGDRLLPIWIGRAEATAIAFAQQGVVPQRPLTHDLMRDLVEALGQVLTQVLITELRDGVFYATLRFESGVDVSARPSDAIALALRTGAPIFAAADVLAEASLTVLDEEEAAAPVADDELERFREFLDTISPEDFGSGADPSA